MRAWLIGGAVGVALLGAGAFAAREPAQLAYLGTAYAAKVTCSCLFVSGRNLDNCKTDYDPNVAGLFAWEVGKEDVTVRALGVFSSHARYEEGFGCTLTR